MAANLAMTGILEKVQSFNVCHTSIGGIGGFGKTSQTDLSYNNFAKSPVPKTYLDYNYINVTTIGDIVYEADLELGGLAKFIRMNGVTWGFSLTGAFLDVDGNSKQFIAKSHSMLSMDDSSLYVNARLSPLSLTYYAHYLANENYSVKLHFAEIIFEGNRSFQILGRRMFDVYIQNVLVLKDFDIKKEAQDIDKAIIRNFTAVVENKILEICFYLAGKWT